MYQRGWRRIADAGGAMRPIRNGGRAGARKTDKANVAALANRFTDITALGFAASGNLV